MITLSKATTVAANKDVLALVQDVGQLKPLGLDKGDRDHLAAQLEGGATVAVLHQRGRLVMAHKVLAKSAGTQAEGARRAGNEAAQKVAAAKHAELVVLGHPDQDAITLAAVEGAALGAYTFTKYKTTGAGNALERVSVVASGVKSKDLDALSDLCDAVYTARDLVNEPPVFLSATQLGNEIRTLAKRSGFKAQVMGKQHIEALGMGGLLAVNKGSVDPPSFSIMEWKPKGAVNKKPIVLVGKGVVYDTGGLSLKPTPNSMDHMKCDMAGAAAVAGAMASIASAKLPVYVVGVVPATDNRPGGDAYAPGDVVRMHSGLTVEVLNTDAEGRIVLADALSYAERYDAELVFTIATLTGAAMRAIGTHGSVVMGTAAESEFARLEQAAENVFERVARMPFWEEYDEEIKSEIADIKNLGSDLAGQITAGKFLARFTTRPLIHIDIAATAFLDKRDHYRVKGGTGVGVRLFHEFIKLRAEQGR